MFDARVIGFQGSPWVRRVMASNRSAGVGEGLYCVRQTEHRILVRNLVAVLVLVLSAGAVAQPTQLPPSPYVSLIWSADDHNEVTVPVDSAKTITITLGDERFYTSMVFQCADRVRQNRIEPRRRPPQIDVVVLKKGECHLTFETSRRKYNLWLIAKESTPESPVWPVSTITWQKGN